MVRSKPIVILITGGGVGYVAVSDRLQFAVGSQKQCHVVAILPDDICEMTPENLFADLTLMTGNSGIIINPNSSEITIDDANETDCSKFNAHNYSNCSYLEIITGTCFCDR